MDGDHAGIVADCADVADVVRHALQLGHDAPQQDRPRRHRPAERRLDGPGVGPGIRDRAVARQAAGQTRTALDIGADEKPLDALVHVTQPLLEPHHRLAVGGEAEMAGLDDAGMDRADRNLVQALALDRQERVALLALASRPATMVEPGPRYPAGQSDRCRRDRAWRARAEAPARDGGRPRGTNRPSVLMKTTARTPRSPSLSAMRMNRHRPTRQQDRARRPRSLRPTPPRSRHRRQADITVGAGRTARDEVGEGCAMWSS